MERPVKTPIDQIEDKYESYGKHLRAIEDAVMVQFGIPGGDRAQIRKAIEAAYQVGRRTTTTDDWCDAW